MTVPLMITDHEYRKLWCLPFYSSFGDGSGSSNFILLVLAEVERKSHGPSFHRVGLSKLKEMTLGIFKSMTETMISQSGAADDSEEEDIIII